MNRSNWARVSLIAAFISAMGHQGMVQAADDTLGLKMAASVRDRLVVRAGAIYVKVKTKSGSTYDVTGPVVRTSELEAIFGPDATPEAIAAARASIYVPDSVPNASDVMITLTPLQKQAVQAGVITALSQTSTGVPLLITNLNANNSAGLGTPPNIKAKAAESMSTGGISLGYYLDDEYKWMVEAYVLAKPLSTSAYAGEGKTQRLNDGANAPTSEDLVIGGKKIVTTKLLPPTVILGRYWGGKDARFQLFTGGMASYLMFYDTKAMDFLNTYVGGSNPGGTTVSMKNKLGFGPTLGFKYNFNDTWHASLNVAYMKVNTQATLMTRNSNFSSATPAIQDLGAPYQETIAAAETVYAEYGSATSRTQEYVIKQNGGVAAVTMKAVAAYRGQSDLGTYVRKTDLTLTNTLFFLSVGRSF